MITPSSNTAGMKMKCAAVMLPKFTGAPRSRDAC